MKENYSNYPSYEEMVEDAIAYMDDVMIREVDVVAEDGKILVEFQVWGQPKGEIEEQILTYFVSPTY
jgi:hypothetical protein